MGIAAVEGVEVRVPVEARAPCDRFALADALADFRTLPAHDYLQ
jgi:hypothetical protein